MKNLLVISLFLLSGLFLCCDNDDNDPPSEPTNAELILGKWYLDESSNTPGGLSDCSMKSYFEFFGGNKLTIVSFQVIDRAECVSLDAVNGTYEFTSENEILLTTPGTVQRLKLVEITNIKFIFSYVEDGSDETVFTTLRKYNLIWSKQV